MYHFRKQKYWHFQGYKFFKARLWITADILGLKSTEIFCGKDLMILSNFYSRTKSVSISEETEDSEQPQKAASVHGGEVSGTETRMWRKILPRKFSFKSKQYTLYKIYTSDKSSLNWNGVYFQNRNELYFHVSYGK